MASFGPGYGAAESRHVRAGRAGDARRWSSRYFVVGTDLADRLAGNGIARRRLEVVRSSLDLRAFTPPDVRRQVERLRASDSASSPGSPVVCYVGSLDERKGVVALPDIVAAARSRSQPVDPARGR